MPEIFSVLTVESRRGGERYLPHRERKVNIDCYGREEMQGTGAVRNPRFNT